MEKLINDQTLEQLHLPQPCQLGIMVDDVEKAAPAFLHFIGEEGFREYRMLNTRAPSSAASRSTSSLKSPSCSGRIWSSN
jgi:hypothetical protein